MMRDLCEKSIIDFFAKFGTGIVKNKTLSIFNLFINTCKEEAQRGFTEALRDFFVK